MAETQASINHKRGESPDAQWQGDPSALNPQYTWRWQQLTADLHGGLLSHWRGKMPPDALILKTDLFEESLTDHCPFARIRSQGLEPMGMDLGRGIAAQARARLSRDGHAQVRVLVTDVRRLGIREGCLDGVFSNSTLDHFRTSEEIDVSLEELYRVLKPGGRLMLTLDNPMNPVIAVRNALPRGLTDGLNITSFYVGKTYGLARAEAKLKEIGFEIEGRGTLAHAPRYLAVRFLRWAESANLTRLQAILSRAFAGMEVMGRLPTAQLTGHFIWVNARKPE